VIAALLPMAFVSGLMGPYMSPIPINASMGMLLSLAIAFVVTPWLARLWLRSSASAHGAAPKGLAARIGPFFDRLFRPLLDARRGRRNAPLLGAAVAVLIAISLALPMLGLVVLKMLHSTTSRSSRSSSTCRRGRPWSARPPSCASWAPT
jgi:multidrug efflux pump subunit AcrB